MVPFFAVKNYMNNLLRHVKYPRDEDHRSSLVFITGALKALVLRTRASREPAAKTS